jgi:hypothetical protein
MAEMFPAELIEATRERVGAERWATMSATDRVRYCNHVRQEQTRQVIGDTAAKFIAERSAKAGARLARGEDIAIDTEGNLMPATQTAVDKLRAHRALNGHLSTVKSTKPEVVTIDQIAPAFRGTAERRIEAMRGLQARAAMIAERDQLMAQPNHGVATGVLMGRQATIDRLQKEIERRAVYAA